MANTLHISNCFISSEIKQHLRLYGFRIIGFPGPEDSLIRKNPNKIYLCLFWAVKDQPIPKNFYCPVPKLDLQVCQISNPFDSRLFYQS